MAFARGMGTLRRAALILTVAGGLAALPAYLVGASAGAGIFVLASLIVTMMTMPEMDHGEVDLFGMAVLALFIVGGLITFYADDRPKMRWTKDSCVGKDCPGSSY